MSSRNTTVYAQKEANVGVLNYVQNAEGGGAANC